MRILKPLLPFAALLLVAASHAQITKSASGYSFKMKFVKGQTMKYFMDSTTTMNGQPKPLQVTTPFTMAVQSISGNVATIKYSVGPMKMGGKATGGVNSVEMKMDTSGKILGNGAAASQMPAQLTLPLKPIKVGGTWTSQATTNTMGMALNVKSTYKLLGITKAAGMDVAKIGVTVVATGNVGSTGTGTMLLALKDASLVSANIKQTITMKGQNGGQGMNAVSNVTIKRL